MTNEYKIRTNYRLLFSFFRNSLQYSANDLSFIPVPHPDHRSSVSKNYNNLCVWLKRKSPYFETVRTFCTPGRNRTGTNSRSSVFETDASTNSATGAGGFFDKDGKDTVFCENPIGEPSIFFRNQPESLPILRFPI